MNSKTVVVTVLAALGVQALNYLVLRLYLPDVSSAVLFGICLGVTLVEFSGQRLGVLLGLNGLAIMAIGILCLAVSLDVLATWTQAHHAVISDVGTKILIGVNTSAGGIAVLLARGASSEKT